MRKNNLTLGISIVSRIIWTTAIALCPSCAGPNRIDIDVSCLFVNERNEEILVRKDNNKGIIICFLESEEQYLWVLETPATIPNEEDTVSIKFKFYSEGTEDDFTEYIGEYTFTAIIYDDCIYSDTCYIH